MSPSSEATANIRQRALAAGVTCLSLAAFALLAPFATTPLGRSEAFIPAYESAFITCNLVTAALLFGQFGYRRSRALLILAAGYLFTAGIASAHALALPGLFAADGLFGAGAPTVAWLYMFAHGGFPLFVSAYAVLDERTGETEAPRPTAHAVAKTVGTAALLVLAGTLLAAVGTRLLPEITIGPRYTPAMIAGVGCVWWASAVALIFLWGRPRSVLDVWLMVAMWAWIFDIGLSTLLNAGRFDLGFYSGRVFGLIAASSVMIALLVENGRNYLRLAEREVHTPLRIDVAQPAPRPESASLARIVQNACTVHHVYAQSKGLALTWSIDRQLGSAYAVDAVRLQQVLQGLIGGAIKLTSRGSVIVRAELLERTDEVDNVRIRVEGTGPGPGSITLAMPRAKWPAAEASPETQAPQPIVPPPLVPHIPGNESYSNATRPPLRAGAASEH